MAFVIKRYPQNFVIYNTAEFTQNIQNIWKIS